MCNQAIRDIPDKTFAAQAKFFTTIGTKKGWRSAKPFLNSRVHSLSEADAYAHSLFRKAAIDMDLLYRYSHSKSEVRKILELALNNIDNLEQALRKFGDTHGMKHGYVFWPVRASVLRQARGLPLFESLEIIGKRRVESRIKEVLKCLS